MARLVETLDPLSEPEVGALVVWFDDERRPTHAGVWSGTRVRSKWGTAHLWQHGLFEVPESYGDDVAFYVRPAREVVLAEFKRYTET